MVIMVYVDINISVHIDVSMHVATPMGSAATTAPPGLGI
jgi:hypothetical protein